MDPLSINYVLEAIKWDIKDSNENQADQPLD